MAESTLMIGGGSRVWAVSLERPLDASGNELSATPPVVACGTQDSSETIVIVEPATVVEVATGREGEILVSSPSVALGYWNNPAATDQVFRCCVNGRREKFLRAGDLGIFRGGHLFVTGRHKDLVIINGVNYYPQDIERTAEEAHASIRRNCSAAFSEITDNTDRLIVVCELDRTCRTTEGRREAADCVMGAILAEHQISVHEVVLVRQGTLPKTSKRKVQRVRCRQSYRDGELSRLELLAVPRHPFVSLPSSHDASDSVERRGMLSWLISYFAQTSGVANEEIGINRSFAAYGLDSIGGIRLAEAHGREYGIVLDVIDVYDHPTPTALATHVVGTLESSHRGSGSAAVSSSSERCNMPSTDLASRLTVKISWL